MKYHISLKVIHWFTAFMVIGLLACGLIMTELDAAIYPVKWQVYAWHKDFGMLVLILTLARLILRNITAIPPLPSNFPTLIKLGAHIVHYSFYAVLIAMPIAGYLMGAYAGRQMHFFGVDLPKFLPENKELSSFFRDTHEIFAWLLVAMVIAHILFALKHRYIDKQDIIYRMM